MVYRNDELRYNTVIKTNFYSDHQAAELGIYGAISMLLTIVNIICMLLMGILVLKVSIRTYLISLLPHHIQIHTK